jgi:hypothetical protein
VGEAGEAGEAEQEVNCAICGKPIVLVPSANERARKYGGSAQFYRDLFSEHVDCALKKRDEETLVLIRKMNQEAK